MPDIRSYTTEKITININTVDLGYIDLLVSEGYYATRTEFIKNAIKRQLESQDETLKTLVKKKESKGEQVSIGIGSFSRRELEAVAAEGRKLCITVIGILVISSDVSMELLSRTVSSIKVYGVSHCRNEIKERYEL